MLPFSRDCLASRDMTVVFCDWLSGRYDFRINAFFGVKDGCGTYRVLCMTSVNVACSVGLSRILTQARWRG